MEVFANALAFDKTLGAEFLKRIGLGDPRVVRVETQVATGMPLRTMDMLLTLQAADAAISELWCERKIGSPFGHEQLDNYERASTTSVPSATKSSS